MYIVVIFCLNIRQIDTNLIFSLLNTEKFGKFRYGHHPISILAATGQYIWEISKNAKYIAKVLANTLAIIEILSISLIWVQQYVLSGCNLGNFHYFPHRFGSSAVKSNGIF